MTSEPKASRLTFTNVFKMVFFPILIMVNPKIYFPYQGDEDKKESKKVDSEPSAP